MFPFPDVSVAVESFYEIETEKVTVPQALLSALLLCFVPCKSPLEWEYGSGGHETVSSVFQDQCTGLHGGFVPSLLLYLLFQI